MDPHKLLNKNPISVTIIVKNPHDAYEIAHMYITDILHQKPDEAPWKLDEWRRTLRGSTELYFLFPLTTRRTRFMKDIFKNGYQYYVYERKEGA